MRYRSRLFELRDELRRLKFEEHPEMDEEVFERLHGGLNFFINNLHRLTVSWSIAQSRKLNRIDKDERARLRRQIKECPVERIPTLYRDMANVLDHVFILNGAGWAVYLVPIGMGWWIFNETKKQISAALLSPSRDLEKVFGVGGDQGSPA